MARSVRQRQFASGRFAYYVRNEKARDQFIKNHDRNADGTLDRYECRLLVSAQFGGPAFGMVNNSYGYGAAPALFALLDEDQDNVLSAAEIENAAARLQSRDRDENDIVDAAELNGTVRGARVLGGAVRAQRNVLPLLGMLGTVVQRHGGAHGADYPIRRRRQVAC